MTLPLCECGCDPKEALERLIELWFESDDTLESILVRAVRGGKPLVALYHRSEEVDRDIMRQLEGLGYYG